MSSPMDERAITRHELRWSLAAGAMASVVFAAILFATLALHRAPPGSVETIDPTTLHLAGEFAEGNLGTTVSPDGRVTVRVVATQFAFVPQCVAVPQGRPVTLRFTSPDVIHGIIVTGTNVNTMVVPGYVSEVHTVFAEAGDHLMPCHEFCGLGHSEMLAPRTCAAAVAVQTGHEREGRLWSPLSAWSSPICGRPSRSSRRRPCSARGRCGSAARSRRRLHTPDNYYISVTAHGMSMAYVLTTFFIMGFGYYVAETALEAHASPAGAGPGAPIWLGDRRRRDGGGHDPVGPRERALHLLSAAHRERLVLSRPRPGGGRLLDLVRADDRRDGPVEARQPRRPVPLAMFATVANAVMWLWTTAGVAVELLFLVIPAALGWRRPSMSG